MKLKVRQILGIVMTAATVLTAVPVTGLTQPEVVKASSRVGTSPRLTLSSSRDHRTSYLSSSNSVKVPVKAELTGLKKGDKILKSEWYLTDSTHSYTAAMKTINKRVNSNGAYRTSQLISICTADYNIISAEIVVLRDGREIFIQSNNAINIKTAHNALTYITRVRKEVSNTSILKVASSYETITGSTPTIKVKYTSLKNGITGSVANYSKLQSITDGKIHITGTSKKPQYLIGKKGAKRVIKKDWQTYGFKYGVAVSGESLEIDTVGDMWKEYFKANKGNQPIIRIPVTVKYQVSIDGKSSSFSKTVNILITE